MHMGHHQKFLAALEAAGIRLSEPLTGRLLEALDAILAEAETSARLEAEADEIQTLPVPVPVPALAEAVEGTGEAGTLATGGRETGAEIDAAEPWIVQGAPEVVEEFGPGSEPQPPPGERLFRG